MKIIECKEAKFDDDGFRIFNFFVFAVFILRQRVYHVKQVDFCYFEFFLKNILNDGGTIAKTVSNWIWISGIRIPFSFER